MNTDNGRIYRGDDEISEARERGEPVADVSEKVAGLMELAQREMTKRERRAAWQARWFGKK